MPKPGQIVLVLIRWDSAAKREFDFPVMILFHRSDGETSAFLEHEQENEHESAGEVQIRKLG